MLIPLTLIALAIVGTTTASRLFSGDRAEPVPYSGTAAANEILNASAAITLDDIPDNSAIGRCFDVSGAVTNIPDDARVWLGFRPEGGDIQPIQAHRDPNKTESWSAHIRLNTQTGRDQMRRTDVDRIFFVYLFTLPRDMSLFIEGAMPRPSEVEVGKDLASYLIWTALPPGISDRPHTTITRSGVPDDGCP